MDRLAGIYLFFSRRRAVDGAQHLLPPLSLPLSLSVGRFAPLRLYVPARSTCTLSHFAVKTWGGVTLT